MKWRPIHYRRIEGGWEIEIEFIPLLLCIAIGYAIARLVAS